MDRSASRINQTYPTDPRGYKLFPKPYGVWQDGILYNAKSVGQLHDSYDPEVETVYDIYTKSATQFADRNAVGVREVLLREYLEDPKDKRKYEKLTLGEYSWLTYAQWSERILNFGAGLVEMSGAKPGDRVLIYAETQRDWMTAALACYHNNLTVVTCYATLGADAASFAVNQTKAAIVIADGKLMPNLLAVHTSCPGLKTVVSLHEMKDEQKKQLTDADMAVATMDEVALAGKDKPLPVVKPSKTDTAVIMYTSGTTGNPKGVILSHGSLVCAMTGINDLFGETFDHNDLYMAYLPLAHIMEMIGELTMIKMGCAMGYGSPHTLTNTGIKLKEGQLGDMVVLKPTVVVFAPLVLEKIYNGIVSKVADGSFIKKWLFKQALESGIENFDKGIVGASSFWNNLVMSKIQANIGGRIRGIITGSAPLASDVHKFIQAVFNCPVRQGYGATETSAASVSNELCDSTAGMVGPPRISCCVKLVDWEEGGYRTADKENAEIGMPRGEIVIGGELVANGYLVDEEQPDPELVDKNNTDFRTEDGIRWFYTGDIGQVDESGSIKIIDRKKDLVKLQQGEYVALSKVEGILKLCPFVENALVHVSSSQKYCTALICPDVKQLKHYCAENSIDVDDLDAACSNATVVAEVLKSVKAMAKGKLAGFETPAKITLIPPSKTWTPENELLTAAMKLKRKPIITAHQAEVDAMYA